MQKINWGIIGCGDVTEKKSGPAFNKVSNSSLVAVMRRDAAKAKDYAIRHKVATWYDDADSLINDPNVNAVYIATPPSSHEQYCLAGIKAGKPVYVEKPLTTDVSSSHNIVNAVASANAKLSVAHYRRAQPLFLKIKQLIEEKVIGEPLFVHLQYFKRPLSKEDLSDNKTAWRVNPAISGGGLFHDLSPHQLDLVCYFFGPVKYAKGMAASQGSLYAPEDMVSGQILFQNDIMFNGSWCFNVPPNEEKDLCEIIGTKGKISFSVFNGHTILVNIDGHIEHFNFPPLEHVQQPMIEKVVSYFLGSGPNPCTINDGVAVMDLIEIFTRKS